MAIALKDSYNSSMDSDPATVNTVEAKNRFNELVALAQKTRQPVVVEKRGEPVAVILDYETYQEKIALPARPARENLIRDLEAWHEYMKKKYPHGTGDSAEILHEVRKERYGL